MPRRAPWTPDPRARTARTGAPATRPGTAARRVAALLGPMLLLLAACGDATAPSISARAGKPPAPPVRTLGHVMAIAPVAAEPPCAWVLLEQTTVACGLSVSVALNHPARDPDPPQPHERPAAWSIASDHHERFSAPPEVAASGLPWAWSDEGDLLAPHRGWEGVPEVEDAWLEEPLADFEDHDLAPGRTFARWPDLAGRRGWAITEPRSGA